MLIGLAAKNAILIVEFAKAKHEQDGMSIDESALESAKLRFRPILMTAFAFILGVVPLMRASGAGAGAQNVMGTAVFWGMMIATALGVFLIPGNFAFVETLGRKHAPAKAEDAMPAKAATGEAHWCARGEERCAARTHSVFAKGEGRAACWPSSCSRPAASSARTTSVPRCRCPRAGASSAPASRNRSPTRPGGSCSRIRRSRS